MSESDSWACEDQHEANHVLYQAGIKAGQDALKMAILALPVAA